MARLFQCGFDYFSTQVQMALVFNGLSANGTVTTTLGRRGTGAANLNSTTAVIDRVLPSTYGTLIFGFALSPGVTPAAATALMFFGDTGLSNSLVQVTIAVDTNNAIRAYRGTTIGTLLGTSANNAISPASFQYVEAKVLVSATVGTVDVQVNGVSVLSLSGLNTKNTANTTMSHIAANGISSSNNYVDDLYVNDTSGSVNNGFSGDTRIDTSFPTGDGHYQQWTPSTGSAHFSLVNATAPQITTFVSDGTTSDKDSYDVTDLTSITGTIQAVQLNIYAQKDDAGARSMKSLIRSNVTDVLSASFALGTGANYVTPMVQETDPNTSAAWTESGFNAAQFGQEAE